MTPPSEGGKFPSPSPKLQPKLQLQRCERIAFAYSAPCGIRPPTSLHTVARCTVFSSNSRGRRGTAEKAPAEPRGPAPPPQQVVNWRMVVFQIVDFSFVASLQLGLCQKRLPQPCDLASLSGGCTLCEQSRSITYVLTPRIVVPFLEDPRDPTSSMRLRDAAGRCSHTPEGVSSYW